MKKSKFYQIKNITEREYTLVDCDGSVITRQIQDVDKSASAFTIQDVKDGDVLVAQNGEMPFIFKECKNNHIYCYCGYTNCKDIFPDRFVDSEGEELHWLNLYHEQAYPATTEQRNLLFQKMHEAGYEWDAEKKELKKKSTEEYNITGIGSKHAQGKLGEMIKNLKSAWSEEDCNQIKTIACHLDNIGNGAMAESLLNIMDKYKSLRPQNAWKPSDRELGAMLTAIADEKQKGSDVAKELQNIYQQLKKLKE